MVNQISNELREALEALERNELPLAKIKLLRASTANEVVGRRLDEWDPKPSPVKGSGFIEYTMKAVEDALSRNEVPRRIVSPRDRE